MKKFKFSTSIILLILIFSAISAYSQKYTEIGTLTGLDQTIDVGLRSSVAFADLDDDNDMDLYTGASGRCILVTSANN